MGENDSASSVATQVKDGARLLREGLDCESKHTLAALPKNEDGTFAPAILVRTPSDLRPLTFTLMRNEIPLNRDCYIQMTQFQDNQVFLIDGPAGSGKTSALMNAMQFCKAKYGKEPIAWYVPAKILFPQSEERADPADYIVNQIEAFFLHKLGVKTGSSIQLGDLDLLLLVDDSDDPLVNQKQLRFFIERDAYFRFPTFFFGDEIKSRLIQSKVSFC